MGTADFDDGFPILRVSEPVDLGLVIFFTGNFLTCFFNLLFAFDVTLLLLTAFFFGCFFGLGFFTMAFLLDAICLHPL